MIEGILIGLTTALTLQNILMVMVGCFFGTIIGMLPGLGPMTAIALMIPITYGFEPATGLILMAIKINPVAGSKPYVIGIIKAIAVIGPRPGSIPMIVPKKQPTITINIFWSVNAVVNPISIPSIIP